MDITTLAYLLVVGFILFVSGSVFGIAMYEKELREINDIHKKDQKHGKL